MIKIGIIGSDSSHAVAFSKLANLPNEQGAYNFDGVRVTCIYGVDEARTAEVAQMGSIPTIVQHPSEMIGQVDAVMIVLRDGSLHAQYALPFIEAGIPTWVDKPFTIDIAEAEGLINAAKQKNTLLAGGSTCKYCYDVLMLQHHFRTIQQQEGILSGSFNFPGDIHSEYGGIYFYGGHAAEILTTIFGEDLRSIRCEVYNNTAIAIVKYDTFPVIINLSDCWQYSGSIYTSSKLIHREIDISITYRLGFEKFIEALRQGKMIESYESLLLPVRILHAIDQSIKTKQEIYL